MENTMSVTKKVNTFVLCLNDQSAKKSNNENTAKQSLFEVSQVENTSPLQVHPSNIDFWNEKHNELPEESVKAFKYFRRTIHFRPSAQSKYLIKKNNQDYQNLEESIIPKLKKILKKLQSPQKQRKNHEKRTLLQNIEENRRENQYQSKLIKRNDILYVQNNFKTKRNSIRVKNSSNQKKSAKLIYSHQLDSPIRKVLSRQKCLNPRQFADQIPLFRQARKKRTLKNILF